jgi:hypothetical protein
MNKVQLWSVRREHIGISSGLPLYTITSELFVLGAISD